MADLNDNVEHGLSSSPKFLKQRKIAYIDNPFDEEACVSMAHECDVKYMNFRPRDKLNGTKAISRRSSGENMEETTLRIGEDLWPLGVRLEGESSDLSSTLQDWSCLFSPVQVKFASYLIVLVVTMHVMVDVIL